MHVCSGRSIRQVERLCTLVALVADAEATLSTSIALNLLGGRLRTYRLAVSAALATVPVLAPAKRCQSEKAAQTVLAGVSALECAGTV